jgi:hypothetical protein
MFRPLLVTALLAFGALVGPAGLAAQAQPAQIITTDELMRATALDEVFTQFGPGIEAAPAEQGAVYSAAMQAAWTAAAREVFEPNRMHKSLARALDNKFEDEDYAAFGAFFNSDFGVRVVDIERAMAKMPPDAQLAARELGAALAAENSGNRRSEQLEEMLKLVNADVANAMIRQSVRGMLIGMAMNNRQGDIQVPWEEIDAHLNAIMPEIEADVAVTQRAILYYAYRDLTEAELDVYLEFLRTNSAQKLYAVAAYSIGEIITERMETFGETLSRKLAQVNI